MPVYTNSNPLKYTKITFNEEMDVRFVLKGAGGGGGGHPDDVNKDYRGGNGAPGESVTGTVRVRAGDVWSVYIGGGGKRGLSWYLGGQGGLGGSSKSGYHGGAGGTMGPIGRSSGGGGGGGASIITANNNPLAIAAGGGGGGGEGLFSSGRDARSFSASTQTYGAAGATSVNDDGGGGGGGGGGRVGGLGGAFGSGDTGGHGGHTGQSLAPAGTTIGTAGGVGGVGGFGDFTNNTNGGDGYFEVVEFILPEHRYTGIYTKDAGSWKQPTPSVKHNGVWKNIQEGYVKHNDKWVRVYPPKVSVEINDYDVVEATAGSPVEWDNSVKLVPGAVIDEPPPDDTPNAVAFIDQFDVNRSAEIVSNTVTVAGINVPVTVSGTDGVRVSINNGPFVTSGTITNGQSLTLMLLSSANFSTKTATTVTIGKTTARWGITTLKAPAPTYAVVPNLTVVKEGETLTYTVSTTNVANGTVLTWLITGNVKDRDFTDRLLTGTVTIQSNSATFTRTLVKNDGNATPEEYIDLVLKDAGGAIVATATRVDIIDVPEGVDPVYPPRGNLLSTYCKGFDKWGVYTNGTGGTYDQLIQSNSTDCGWTDDDPNAFTFENITNAEISTEYTASATITGITGSVLVSSNADLMFAKNGSSTYSKTINISNGDTVTVKRLSSPFYSRVDTYSITIGRRTGSWSISTRGGTKPTARTINWSGPFNSNNQTVSFDLAGNSTNTSSKPFTSARIVAQPKHGTVTISGTTAVYTPNTNASRPSTLSDFQASTYIAYWTDLYPNGIKSIAMAKNHWAITGIGEQRFIPTIFSGADSFTWTITNEHGESNIASCLMQFSAPTVPSLDDVGPEVISVQPANGATNISKNTTVVATFSEQLVPGTGTITMTGSNGTSYSWTNSTATVSGQLVSFSAGVLAEGVTYTVNIPAGFVKDFAANNSSAYSWSFKVADTQAPYVISVTRPANTNHLLVKWSEPVRVAHGEVEILRHIWYNEWWRDGYWYANYYDIESYLYNMTQVDSTTTKILVGPAYWISQISIMDGAVTDLSGNPSQFYSGAFDEFPYLYNGYRWGGWRTEITAISNTSLVDVTPQPDPVKDPIVNTTDNVVITSDSIIAGDTGSILRNNDWLTNIKLNEVNTYIDVINGSPIISVDSATQTATVQIPAVTNISATSSTPTSVVGTVDPLNLSTFNISLSPDASGNLSMAINASQPASTAITSVPLSLAVEATFASGLTVNSTINTVVNTPQLVDWQSGNYSSVDFSSSGYSSISYGGRWDGFGSTDIV